jgi:hypothetical protein
MQISCYVWMLISRPSQLQQYPNNTCIIYYAKCLDYEAQHCIGLMLSIFLLGTSCFLRSLALILTLFSVSYALPLDYTKLLTLRKDSVDPVSVYSSCHSNNGNIDSIPPQGKGVSRLFLSSSLISLFSIRTVLPIVSVNNWKFYTIQES